MWRRRGRSDQLQVDLRAPSSWLWVGPPACKRVLRPTHRGWPPGTRPGLRARAATPWKSSGRTGIRTSRPGASCPARAAAAQARRSSRRRSAGPGSGPGSSQCRPARARRGAAGPRRGGRRRWRRRKTRRTTRTPARGGWAGWHTTAMAAAAAGCRSGRWTRPSCGPACCGRGRQGPSSWAGGRRRPRLRSRHWRGSGAPISLRPHSHSLEHAARPEWGVQRGLGPGGHTALVVFSIQKC